MHKIPIPIPILSVVATTAILTTACSAPPVVHDSGPSPASCTQGPGEPPCPGGAGVWRPSIADSAIAAAKKFGADELDTVAATAALTTGRPFLVGLPDGGNDRCHAALLTPDDPDVWILNRSSTPTEGAALERELLQYGCGAGMDIPRPSPNAPAPTLPLDTAARDAAQRDGKPFLYGLPSGPVAACHTAVVLPDGMTWILNRSGGATVAGDALDQDMKEYGCTSRGSDNPTTSKGN
ncbi:hypothetical protein [Mycobacteroides abscessus]|nr:hypothetical protein [Mycobacteroides abscessus]MDO2981362.1 hypothetical protein [Mycobacteroides abscessus subsp. abscessus]